MRVTILMDIWSVCWRELKRFSRQRARIAATIIQPMIWLVFMSNTFAGVGKLPGFPTSSYLEYMAPGIVVMSTLFGGVFGGLSVVWDRRFGFLNKMLASPIGRSSIPVGKMLASALQSTFQSSIILGAALLMGVKCVTGPLGILASISIAMLLCLLLSAISLSLGAVIKTHETLMVLMNFLTMPLIFTSSALFPPSYMPSWLAAIARWNPLSFTVDSIRTILIDGWSITIIPKIAVLASLTLSVTFIATLLFNRSVE